ncbi:MAG: imidazole glycerol phosphate synthase subunit HisH [Gemmatimonadaceae bacterium]
MTTNSNTNTRLRNTRLHVTLFDYGAGNLHSLSKALETDDTEVRVECDPVLATQNTDALILPGVGAFAPAAERLAPGLNAVRDALARGLPCLGICLGMQLLFDSSTEGPGQGLGVFSGQVDRLTAKRIPQIGWNSLEYDSPPDPLFVESGLQLAYFANSFVARPARNSIAQVIAWTEHDGDRFPSAVRHGHVIGAQFHPEKSSQDGVRFIHAFLNEAASVQYSTVNAPRASASEASR